MGSVRVCVVRCVGVRCGVSLCREVSGGDVWGQFVQRGSDEVCWGEVWGQLGCCSEVCGGEVWGQLACV